MTNEDSTTVAETETKTAVVAPAAEQQAFTEHAAQHLLQQLQMEIATLPAVDAERVKAAMQKLQAGKLDILGTEAQQQASAERIAKQIVDETTGIS